MAVRASFENSNEYVDTYHLVKHVQQLIKIAELVSFLL